MSAADGVGSAPSGRRARRVALAGAVLCAVGVTAALVSVFGPLPGLWYAVAVLVAAIGAALLVLCVPGRLLGRVALLAAVVLTAVAVVGGPWLTQRTLPLGAQPSRSPDRPVFVHGEDGLVGVTLPGSGRYVDWTTVDRPAVYEDEVVSSAGWVFRSDPTTDGLVVYALDLGGDLLWTRDLGPGDAADRRRHGVLAATPQRAILLRCRGEQRPCVLEAVDRQGRTAWTRQVPADSRSPRDLWSSRAQVPTRPWLDSTRSEHDTTRTTQYRPSDGRAVRTVDDVALARLTPDTVALISEKADGPGCRVRLVRRAETVWTHDYDGAGCGLQRSDTAATRWVAYPAPGVVMDLRSGEIHRYAVAGDADRAADLVLENGSRLWVTDPLSGGVLWRVPHEATVLAGPFYTAAYWYDRSTNPFRPRSESSDSARTVKRVKVAPAGSRDPVTCDLPADARLLAVVGTHTLVVDLDDEERLWTCR